MAEGSVERVRDALRAKGMPAEIVTFAQSTRTAAEAAAAVGCAVAQICKSLVFRAKPSGRAVLVLTSGANRVDEARVAAALGEGLGMADAAFVRDATGFAIGGVAPIGHDRGGHDGGGRVVTFIDRDLEQHSRIWAAAGSPYAVFETTPANLVAMTGGRVIQVS